MSFIHDLPIRRKLTLISMLTSATALLVACAIFVVYEQMALRQAMVRDLATTAQMIAFNSESALDFHDPDSARQTMKGLAAQPHVTFACIYDAGGRVFAGYQRDPTTPAWPAVQPAGERFTSDALELFRPIISSGENIGAIYLRSDLHELRDRLWRYISIATVVLLVAALTAWFITSRIQRVISEPVSQLAAVAGRIAREKNYALRARKTGSDELGDLIDGFNAMLVQIQQRDRDLQDAHDELEKRVEARTAALQQAQEATLREQARFKLIFEAVPVGISYYAGPVANHPDITLINHAHLEICGLAPEQAQDVAAFKQLTHPDDRVRQQKFEDRMNRGEISRYTIEKRYVRSDGKTVWVAFSTQRNRTPAGGFEHLSTIVDITALKRAQEATAQKESQLRFIFEAVPFSITWVRYLPDNGAESMFNPAFYRITGLDAAKPPHIDDVRAITHPDDLKRQDELRRHLDQGKTDDLVMEKRYLRPDGATVWALLTIKVYRQSDGRIQEEVSTLVDITERKAAEHQLAESLSALNATLESTVDGILVVDARGRVINSNRKFSAMWTIPPELMETGNDHQLMAHVMTQLKDPATFKAKIEQLQGQPDAESFDILEFKDGRIYERYSQPQRVNGRSSGRVWSFRDITERKQAELELEKLHRQLLTTSRQAGMAEVATGVLHNVGNVLNSVNVSATLVIERVRHSKSQNLGKVCALLNEHAGDLGGYLAADAKGRMIPGYLVTLAENLSDEQQYALTELEHLRKNIDHIKDIVTMQQSYAKTSGVTETVSVPDLVEDALRMNAGSLARHDIDLVREYQAKPVITVDKHKVLQILVNLVRNAKYACDESGRIDKQVTARITADDHHVGIAITDNGVGIAPENLTLIFAHGFTTREQGHGFGLHSGALAATELGGSLTAHSAGPGQGATFLLKLPYAKAPMPYEKLPS